MRFTLLALLALVPTVALAQSTPQMDRRVTLSGPTGLNWAMGTKVDVQNGSLKNPTETGGTYDGFTLGANTPGVGTFKALTIPSGGSVSGDFSAATLTQPSNVSKMTLQGLLNNLGIVPDAYVQTGDNGDWALAINRASVAACSLGVPVRFQSHTYALASTASPQCVGQMWIGQKWTESLGTHGTWFSISDPAINPLQVRFGAVVIDSIAFAQSHPAPSATYPTAWQPTTYQPVIQVLGATGVSLRNIFLDGVYAGIFADGSGRLTLDNIYGQVFNKGIVVQHSLDSDHYGHIHFWPYWSSNPNVLAYTATNLVTFLTGRVDTAFLTDMFTYSANVGLELAEDTATSSYSGSIGPTTKFRAHTVSCDGTRYCVAVAGTGVTAHIDSINEQGQDFAASVGGQSLASLTASQALHIASGQAVLQIGDIQAQFIQQSSLGSTSTTGCSYIKIGSLFVDWKYSASNPYYVDAVQCAGTSAYNTFLFSTPPFGQNSTGTVTGQTSNGGASLMWAAVTAH